MSLILCVFLQLTFSAAWSTAQRTISDRDNCEDCSRCVQKNYPPKRQVNPCPPGFNYTVNAVNKCYAVLARPVSWDNAGIECKKLDSRAHLTVINSALENQIISEILKRHNCLGGTGDYNWFWTSGRRQSTSDCSSQLVWESDPITSQAIEYKNYCPLEPNCANIGNSGEHCLSFSKTCFHNLGRPIGGWQDVRCENEFCPICEVLRIE